MKNLFLTIILILPFGVFNSCQNEESLLRDREKLRLFTDDQISKIGELHNQSIESAFANFNWNSIDKKEELKTQFNNLDLVRENQLTIKFNTNTTDENLEGIKNKLKNKSSFSYFEDAVNFISSEKTVDEIINHMRVLENRMNNESVNVKDYETFLVFSSVLKSSAKFWLPIEKGGQGKFNYYKNMLNSANNNLNKPISVNNNSYETMVVTNGWKDGLVYKNMLSSVDNNLLDKQPIMSSSSGQRKCFSNCRHIQSGCIGSNNCSKFCINGCSNDCPKVYLRNNKNKNDAINIHRDLIYICVCDKVIVNNNLLHLYHKRHPADIANWEKCFKAVIFADGRGAAASFTGVAFGIMITSSIVNPVCTLATIAISSGLASASELLFNDDCAY